MDILPAIDLRSGKCVRLLQGDYSKQIDYADDPVAVAHQFEQAGARWLHLVDLDGAREGRPCNLPVIERVLRGTSLKLEVGGGLREAPAIESLLEVGVQRCVVGTKALENWAWFESLVQRATCRGRVCLGLDARLGKVAVRGWTEELKETALEIADRAAALPVAAIIYTDISRDGMLQGANIEAMKEMAERSKVSVVASGGVTNLDDVKRLAALPLAGIIIGRAIYERTIDLAEAIQAASSPG
ncbi:MAG TPA: 1-(5-phosphoribosyl)-5-[(5-phosphoribosylamino)methylideneamino]imidazole-4-carboxamide isomerase [Phycisphaerae bacterium]|nr:1-(5-phosphoribosyl)-5-[(5-phosphoribosylamino)methylideneamino]imidazole-4-carboxamide isomerase [Phycisphaerae bacterium]